MNSKELKKAVRALPPIDKFDHQWQKRRKSMRYHMLNEKVSEFTRWSTVNATMYHGNSDYAPLRLRELRKERFEGRYEKALITPNIGKPEFVEKKIGANYIHQAHHVMRMERALWIQMENMKTIAEFGAGYGAMCNIIHNMGFNGVYHVYDFPEMLLLQRYYLERVKKNAVYHERPHTHNVDLLIAICSLSEAPMQARQEFLAKVKAQFYYIRFQKRFFDIDNLRFFTQWAERHLEEGKWTITSARRANHTILAGVSK